MNMPLGNVGFGKQQPPIIMVISPPKNAASAIPFSSAANAAKSNFLSTLRTGEQLGSRLNQLA